MSDRKRIYLFGGGKAEGSAAMKDQLGGKGAGLAEMTTLGIPVPPGFTITTDVCNEFYARGGVVPEGLAEEVRAGLRHVEQAVGAKFGDPANPLLVSVRSGARVSMPGMMDTVLNLGLNDRTVEGLIARTGDARFAFDSYRRFVQMYGDVVLGLKPESAKEEDPFERILAEKKRKLGVERDVDLPAQALRELVGEFKEEILRRKGKAFPEAPEEQLWGAIGAVFGSWMNRRAVEYRKIYSIPSEWGTAVTVQAMVFGNMGDDCATGVAFTRDPSTGEKRFFGEYLVNAQGEDVVAGIRTPAPIRKSPVAPGASMEEKFPEAYRHLCEVYERLERHFRDMQDLEFTVQRGRLWLLQTRTGKRTARAMIKIAVDMLREGLIDKETAILRVEPAKLEELLHPTVDPKAPKEVIAQGLPASPGAAVGKVLFSADEAEALAEKGEKVVLVRVETSPEDIHGMKAAQGILTARGGMTSHAAVVGRGMGKCCVVGCSTILVDYARERFTTQGGVVVSKGDVITLDGSRGEVLRGAVPMVPAKLDDEYALLMRWADDARRLRIRTNADTPADAATARAFGAEGIGLCRTEHMFFEPDRILAVRQMILADDEAGRRAALAKILPMQKGDFAGIFRAMDGFAVTVRLLDPPLHEFLPYSERDLDEVAKALGVPLEKVRERNDALHEFNPMLGHRGCRLAVTYPEIYETQVRALMEAAVAVAREGKAVKPEIMIPIVGITEELARMRALVEKTASEVLQAARIDVPYTIGTMIELPRACVVADRIAAYADFFSFGTNDLTQTTFGLSRDDAGRFLPVYLKQGILVQDPFVVLDREGVGSLMRMARDQARSVKPKIKLGICGEHGGEPSSIEFCHRIGLDYVSCSPFRVPIARIAAAQAAIREKQAGQIAESFAG